MIHFLRGSSFATEKHLSVFRVPSTATCFNSVFCTLAVCSSSVCWTFRGDEIGQCLGFMHLKKGEVKLTAARFSVKV